MLSIWPCWPSGRSRDAPAELAEPGRASRAWPSWPRTRDPARPSSRLVAEAVLAETSSARPPALGNSSSTFFELRTNASLLCSMVTFLKLIDRSLFTSLLLRGVNWDNIEQKTHHRGEY